MSESVTITAHNQFMFEVGQVISIGSWPRWMWRLHLPESWRCWIQRKTLDWFGRRIGPQTFTITALGKNSEMTLAPR